MGRRENLRRCLGGSRLIEIQEMTWMKERIDELVCCMKNTPETW